MYFFNVSALITPSGRLGFFGNSSYFDIILGITQIAVFAIFSATLWYTARQFKLLQNESEARNRPYLGIDNTDQKVQSLDYALFIKNFGTMPAYDVDVTIVGETNEDKQSVKDEPQRSALIPPGRRNHIPIKISPQFFERICQGQDQAKLHLKLVYWFGKQKFEYNANLKLSTSANWEIEKEYGT